MCVDEIRFKHALHALIAQHPLPPAARFRTLAQALLTGAIFNAGDEAFDVELQETADRLQRLIWETAHDVNRAPKSGPAVRS